MTDRLEFLAGTSHPTLARLISQKCHKELVPVTISTFPNSETSIQIHGSVSGADVFIVQAVTAPTNNTLMELLLMVDAARRGSAKRVTAVLPHLGYARQDRVSRPGEPVSAQVIARLLKAVGLDQIIVVDPHSLAFGEFCTLEQLALIELSAVSLLARSIEELDFANVQIVSPDKGGMIRAEQFARLVTPGRPPLVIPKKRLDHETVTMDEIIGEVGETAIIVDDVLSTGGTICEAARLLDRSGAKKIWVAVTHGEFIGQARAKLGAAPISGLLVTDSLPVPARRLPKGVHRVSLAALLSEEIGRSHRSFS